MHIRSLLSLLLGVPPCTGGHAPDTSIHGTAPEDGYVLVWADEFDTGTRPDTSNWGYEHGFVRNGEDQWYQEENATVADGHLLIEGRFELRGRIPVGAGIWPANGKIDSLGGAAWPPSGRTADRWIGHRFPPNMP